MAKFPKLMVLSTSLPGTRHGGGVVYDAILEAYPRDRYVCVSLRPPSWRATPGQAPASLAGVPCLAAPVAPEPSLRGSRFYLPVVRALGFLWASPWRVRQVVNFGRRHGVDMVWAEFYKETLLLAPRVAAGLGVPLVGTIWDDPAGWLLDGGYDRLSRRLLLARFREALGAATRVSVVSEAMQRDYRGRYGLESSLLRFGHNLSDAPDAPVRHPEATVVGFAGSVYGEDAWRAFLAACARLNEGGRLPPLKIQLFGAEGFPYPHPGVEVTCQGWLPLQEMLRNLAATDFCYLPYWFTPERHRHAQLSFPTKLTTYLAAGRPVLYHGPADADVSSIIRTQGLGLRVHSLASEDLKAAVTRLATDRQVHHDCQRAADRAFHLEFNDAVMRRNFAKLIGIAPESWG
jgi:hypothetical protein